MKYPCFQNFFFLHLDLSRSPVYPQVIEQTQSGHLLLDLGCGLGQDIRRLVQDGAPAENLIGLDVVPEYIDLGYQLFMDRSKQAFTFLIQDFFEDTPEMDDLKQRVKVINSGYFMHLWSWEIQLNAAKHMIQLLSPDKGAIITGVHFGSPSPGMWTKVPPGLSPMFLHNKETLSELWIQAGKQTQTTWTIQIAIEHDKHCKDIDSDGYRLRWAVMRR